MILGIILCNIYYRELLISFHRRIRKYVTTKKRKKRNFQPTSVNRLIIRWGISLHVRLRQGLMTAIFPGTPLVWLVGNPRSRILIWNIANRTLGKKCLQVFSHSLVGILLRWTEFFFMDLDWKKKKKKGENIQETWLNLSLQASAPRIPLCVALSLRLSRLSFCFTIYWFLFSLSVSLIPNVTRTIHRCMRINISIL